MPQKIVVDETHFNAGLWYYKIRALPLKALKEEFSMSTLKKLKLIELYARLKWKNPASVLWTIEDFQEQVKRLKLSNVIKVYRGMYNLPILIPYTHFFYKAFASYPNLNTVYGERGAGKTIFGWVTAYKVWQMAKDRYDDFEIYVYGDVDGLTQEVKRRAPTEFAKKLIMMEDYEAPEPNEKVGKFILYNELDKTLLSGNNFKKEQQAVDIMLYRSRHYQYWMFYNVIRYKSIMKTVRITSSFQSIKPLSQKLMEEVVEEAFPKSYKNVILQALSDLDYKESITSIPLYRSDMMGVNIKGSKQSITITPIEAPEWLLDAAKNATKNYAVGSEIIKKRERELVERAVKMFLNGESLNHIVEHMEIEEGYKRSYTWWRAQVRKYLINQGYEFSSLSEVQENERLRRLSEKISG